MEMKMTKISNKQCNKIIKLILKIIVIENKFFKNNNLTRILMSLRD